MGRPKALLPLPGGTFLEVLTHSFCHAGIGPILAVLGDEAQEIRHAVKLDLLRVVINPDPSRGQLSSIHCGLDALAEDEVEALFIAPVDAPRVSSATLRKMMEALAGHSLVVPVHRGRRGHPPLFASSLFQALRRAPLEAGARALVRATVDRLELPCDDPAVLEDFDVPEQLPRA